MKLKLENLDVTSFATAATPVAHSAIAAATAGEDCFSRPWVCPWTKVGTD